MGTYPTQKYLKPRYRLTPEEEEVRQALIQYSDDPDQASLSDFTPSEVLFDTYMNHVNQYARTFKDPAILTRSQLGAAVRRVFANLEAYPHLYGQRTVNGTRVCGFAGLKGPESTRVQTRPGNPRWKAAPVPASVPRGEEGDPGPRPLPD